MSSSFSKIDRLRVSNFQSLSEADIELGGLTVIVGPSNSGKSAFLRALKAVVRNVNSPSSVRAGKTTFTSEIEFSGTKVSIERGKSQSTYRVILADGTEDVFTKSGRSVPEEIQKLLALPEPEGPDLTFSSQIDPPFLLSETGSTVAKVLGDLTNVSRLHAAAKEANRRRLEASRLAEVRKKDALAVAVRMRDEFGNIREQASLIKKARGLFDGVRAQAALAERASKSLRDLDLLEVAISDLEKRIEEMPVPADVEAQTEQVLQLISSRHQILNSISEIRRLAEQADAEAAALEASAKDADEFDAEYRQLLIEAGTCPVCNQGVKA